MTFRRVGYASAYISFQAVETEDVSHQPLQVPTAPQARLWDIFTTAPHGPPNAPRRAIPLTYVAGRYFTVGSQFSTSVIAGLSHLQIARRVERHAVDQRIVVGPTGRGRAVGGEVRGVPADVVELDAARHVRRPRVVDGPPAVADPVDVPGSGQYLRKRSGGVPTSGDRDQVLRRQQVVTHGLQDTHRQACGADAATRQAESRALIRQILPLQSRHGVCPGPPGLIAPLSGLGLGQPLHAGPHRAVALLHRTRVLRLRRRLLDLNGQPQHVVVEEILRGPVTVTQTIPSHQQAREGHHHDRNQAGPLDR